jgi:hypothetical protein
LGAQIVEASEAISISASREREGMRDSLAVLDGQQAAQLGPSLKPDAVVLRVVHGKDVEEMRVGRALDRQTGARRLRRFGRGGRGEKGVCEADTVFRRVRRGRAVVRA